MKRPRSQESLTATIGTVSRLFGVAAFCACWWGLTELLRLHLPLLPSLLLGLLAASLLIGSVVFVGFRGIELGCIWLILLIFSVVLTPVFIRAREKATRTRSHPASPRRSALSPLADGLRSNNGCT